MTFAKNTLYLTKRIFLKESQRELSLSEIFSYGVGFSLSTSDYESKGVDPIENTPEEIRDVVVEMAERLTGVWQAQAGDEALQQRFWEIFPAGAVDVYEGRPLHGEIRARYGATFLRKKPEWLQ